MTKDAESYRLRSNEWDLLQLTQQLACVLGILFNDGAKNRTGAIATLLLDPRVRIKRGNGNGVVDKICADSEQFFEEIDNLGSQH